MTKSYRRRSIVHREAEAVAASGAVVISTVGAFHAGDALVEFTIDCHANSPWVLAACTTHAGAISFAGVMVNLVMLLAMAALGLVSLRHLARVVLGPMRIGRR